MKKIFIAVSVILLLTITAFTQTDKKMKTIVLVHGAWADASAWNAVTPLLKAAGHEVIVVNLPGHGNDKTPFAGIQLKTYTDAVKSAIGTRTNIVLVGHSMAGIVISQTAEEIPAQIQKLVYLAAYLPVNGESLFVLAQQDPDAHVGKSLTLDEKTMSAVISPQAIPDIFAADAPKPVQEYLVTHTQPEPLAPLNSPVVLTQANFGQIKKAYIHTINDNTISYPLQQKLVKKATNLTNVYALPSSHTPFISMPGVVASVILQEAK